MREVRREGRKKGRVRDEKWVKENRCEEIVIVKRYRVLEGRKRENIKLIKRGREGVLKNGKI